MDNIILSKEESDLLYKSINLIDRTGIRCVVLVKKNYHFETKQDCYSVNLVSGGTYFYYKEDSFYDIIDSFFKSKIRGVKIDKLLNG